jgi:hypothetical protein
MTDLRFSTYDATPFAQTFRPLGFIQQFIAALHHSRRLQGAAELRRYKHLIDPACGYQLSNDLSKWSSENAGK